ncbi:hypothetical protein NB722_003335 [Xanthomonas sacchari]|uniref:hypothetical protein n=1 Tax=Xanthomonas sacchari TaxID=56458 RepID=UPI002253C9A5|nr:hypothetical protein [Xanthomonas sacchari]MCW0388796.1 hypothetical protein [Xanthomonas sacchari]
MDRKPLRIIVEDEIDGQPISLQRVPLHLIREFAKEAEQFLRGGGGDCADEDLLVKVESGSLAVEEVCPSLDSAYRDLALLEVSSDVANIDQVRASVILKWQRKSQASSSRKYRITDGARAIWISHNTSFFASDHSMWLPVTRKIVGEIQDMGGTKKANIHIATSDGVLIVAADQKTLAEEKDNRLYKKVLISIAAEQNTVTKELRHPRLIRFETYSPMIQSESMERMKQVGADAWKDVDAVNWVRRNREG